MKEPKIHKTRYIVEILSRLESLNRLDILRSFLYKRNAICLHILNFSYVQAGLITNTSPGVRGQASVTPRVYCIQYAYCAANCRQKPPRSGSLNKNFATNSMLDFILIFFVLFSLLYLNELALNQMRRCTKFFWIRCHSFSLIGKN